MLETYYSWIDLPPYFTNDSIEREVFQPEFDRTCSRKQLLTLLSDAEFYCDPNGPDMCPPGLKQSARAVIRRVKAILK